MKRALGLMLFFALLSTTGCSAGDHDFNSVVAGMEQHYSVRAQRVPLMGLVSLCARATTHGGVKDLRVVEFDNIGTLDGRDLDSMMQAELGSQWQPMVKERSRGDASLSEIFVRSSEDSRKSMGMMVADYENGELDLVRMEMNGSALARWMNDRNMQKLPFVSQHWMHRQTD